MSRPIRPLVCWNCDEHVSYVLLVKVPTTVSLSVPLCAQCFEEHYVPLVADEERSPRDVTLAPLDALAV